MKKIMMIAIIMVLSFVVVPDAYAVNVGKDEGSQLNEKIQAAIAGDGVITLTDDITISEKIDIDASSKELTIDLGTHTITATGTRTFNIKNGSVTIQGNGGKIINNTASSDDGSIYVYGTGNTHLTIEKGVTIEGITPVIVSNNGNNTGIVVDIKGDLVNNVKQTNVGGAALTVHGNIKTGNPTINISGNLSSTVEKGAGIFQAGQATTTVSGTVSGKSGIVVKSGTLTLNNATVTATGTYEDPTASGNGFQPTGSAIQVESNNNYAGNVHININGGKITSEDGYAIEEYSDAGADSLEELIINGNTTLKSGDEKELYSFTKKEFEPTVPKDKVLQKNEDGTYTYVNLNSKTPSDKSEAPKDNTKNPDTSDINLYLLLTMMVVSGCGIAYSFKRRFN